LYVLSAPSSVSLPAPLNLVVTTTRYRGEALTSIIHSHRTPPLKPTMLDRLPAEILLDVLALTLPLDDSAYRERQDALLVYCQVDRYVCGFAQPLLARHFRPSKALASILKRNPKLVDHVRSMRVHGEVPSFGSVFKAIAKMSNLHDLRISNYREDMKEDEMKALSGSF
jgi:hypothetical protein